MEAGTVVVARDARPRSGSRSHELRGYGEQPFPCRLFLFVHSCGVTDNDDITHVGMAHDTYEMSVSRF